MLTIGQRMEHKILRVNTFTLNFLNNVRAIAVYYI